MQNFQSQQKVRFLPQSSLRVEQRWENERPAASCPEWHPHWPRRELWQQGLARMQMQWSTWTKTSSRCGVSAWAADSYSVTPPSLPHLKSSDLTSWDHGLPKPEECNGKDLGYDLETELNSSSIQISKGILCISKLWLFRVSLLLKQWGACIV